MSGNYPTKEELKIIRKWDVTRKSPVELLQFIQGICEYGENSMRIKGKKIILAEFHTFGWSGNEDIIGALQDNYLFWVMCWQKSERGGHYWFRIDTKLFEVKDPNQ